MKKRIKISKCKPYKFKLKVPDYYKNDLILLFDRYCADAKWPSVIQFFHHIEPLYKEFMIAKDIPAKKEFKKLK